MKHKCQHKCTPPPKKKKSLRVSFRCRYQTDFLPSVLGFQHSSMSKLASHEACCVVVRSLVLSPGLRKAGNRIPVSCDESFQGLVRSIFPARRGFVGRTPHAVEMTLVSFELLLYCSLVYSQCCLTLCLWLRASFCNTRFYQVCCLWMASAVLSKVAIFELYFI